MCYGHVCHKLLLLLLLTVMLWAHLQVVLVEVWQHAEVHLRRSKAPSHCSSAYALQPAGQEQHTTGQWLA